MKTLILLLTLLTLPALANEVPQIEFSCSTEGDGNQIELHILGVPGSNDRQVVITRIEHSAINAENAVYIAELLPNSGRSFPELRSDFETLQNTKGLHQLDLILFPTKLRRVPGKVSLKPIDEWMALPTFNIICDVF